MLCINNTNIDPYFNLATEEYLLKNCTDDIVMLWQNEPSVIIGKNQNARAEVNSEIVAQKGIKVARRFSGGGAVYHDLGNLNITFIDNKTNVDFSKYAFQIQYLLKRLGVNADVDKRYTLTIDGLKISGSAQCVHKNRIMYHATLLFSSDINDLTAVLESKEPLQLQCDTRYVQSVRSRVTNIQEYLPGYISIGEFKEMVVNHFSNNSTLHTLNADDITAIRKIADAKYATYEWNYNKVIKKIIE